MQKTVKILLNVSIIIAVYYFTYYFYLAYINPVMAPGDSYDYHIPIAYSILNGSFINLHAPLPRWYYPGSSEAINALFIPLHIPLTFCNFFATLILCFCCYKLARTFNLQKDFALLFALTFITLNAIVRWLNAISIDIWVAIFFILGVILLENPKKSLLYFAKLGFVLGMLIGSKYTTPIFILILGIFYIKKLVRFISFSRIIAYIIPFSLFGLFWYIRNFILTGNPFYPLKMLGFNGPLDSNDPVMNETIHQPLTSFNAFFGEYHIWIFAVIVATLFIINKFVINKKFALDNISKIFLLGLILFVYYFNFPTSAQPWIMVSSLRYSFSAFILLILGIFLLASKYKKEDYLGYFAIANSLSVLTMIYYPKLLLISVPISLFLISINNYGLKTVLHSIKQLRYKLR